MIIGGLVVLIMLGIFVGSWCDKHKVPGFMAVVLSAVLIVGLVMSLVASPLILILVWLFFRWTKNAMGIPAR